VILAEPDTDKVLVKVPKGQSVEWLASELRRSLKIDQSTKLTLKYYDQDFAEYVPFNSIDDLPSKAKVKVYQ
jgi:hypothetical protein